MSGKMYGRNIELPPLDNLFSSENERQESKLEKVRNIRLDELFPFKDHPFQVRDDGQHQGVRRPDPGHRATPAGGRL